MKYMISRNEIERKIRDRKIRWLNTLARTTITYHSTKSLLPKVSSESLKISYRHTVQACFMCVYIYTYTYNVLYI